MLPEYLDIVTFLLQFGGDEILTKSFYIACHNGNADIMKYISTKLSNSTKQNILNNGIIYATHSYHLETFKNLIEMGADVNAKYSNGKNVLNYACNFYKKEKDNSHDEIDVVKLLLERGAKTFYEDEEYLNSPLCHAVSNTDTTILENLLKYGANPNMQGTKNIFNPLTHAFSYGNLEAASKLIEYGANVGDVGYLLKLFLVDSARYRLTGYNLEKVFIFIF